MSLFYSGYHRTVLVVFALAVAVPLSAQMPSMKAAGKEDGSVYLQKLSVDVKVAGTLATTTWTMTFRNKTQRILEGELNFPLPAGTSVSRYALDINGNMREAVPVTKEKATVLFETVERRRVDPGILEKVEGNTFRTRIYPINAGGVRTVIIAYEQDLAGDSRNEMRYSLPLSFALPIEDFRIDISVIHSTIQPVFEKNTPDALQFKEWKDNWSATHHWNDYLADQSIIINIPKAMEIPEVMMQQVGNHYFYTASVYLQPKKIDRPAPGHLTILWDASLSGLTRNKKKELELLDAYFARLHKVDVTLVEFSNTVQEPKQFSVVNGEWSALRGMLENSIYDGATQFGVLDLKNYPCDEFLLFSDGHSNFGSSDIRLNGRAVYPIVSTAGADFPFLQGIAQRSAGELIDMESSGADHARDQLLYESLQFLGVRPVEGVEESYPSLATPVTGSFTIAGMTFQRERQIVLQFGYAGKVTIEQPVTLDYSRQQTDQPDLSKVWAQKKIAELDTRYEDNRTLIEQLGRRYGIVTRNTSLIVLESVNDYITYQVEPPADLRAEYDRIMKQRGSNNIRVRDEAVSNAEEYFNELLEWWRQPYHPEGKLKNIPEVDRSRRPDRVTADTAQYEALYAPPRVAAAPGASAQLEGRASGVQVTTRERNVDMDEVVVRGYAPQHRKDLTGAVSTVHLADDESKYQSGELQRKSTGNGNFTAAAADQNLDYLRQLKAATAVERYALYLQLRKEHLHAPLFYFRTAEFFLGSGQSAVGLKILSNIAELETENYELEKMLGYKLKELGETEAECAVFEKIMEWRPFEPQSYRDYGLALEDAGRYQQALDTLCYAITKNYDGDISSLYPGIEETLIPEINSLIANQKSRLDISRVPRTLITNMPVDIRVVVNWNRPNTDIDLWVTDPDNEKCYYAHRFTQMGGRISHDFTRGLGPEQFLLRQATKGSYKVEVNYFGDTQVALAGETTIMVEVYTNYGTPKQHRTIITLQMQKGSGGAVYVGDFEFK